MESQGSSVADYPRARGAAVGHAAKDCVPDAHPTSPKVALSPIQAQQGIDTYVYGTSRPSQSTATNTSGHGSMGNSVCRHCCDAGGRSLSSSWAVVHWVMYVWQSRPGSLHLPCQHRCTRLERR